MEFHLLHTCFNSAIQLLRSGPKKGQTLVEYGLILALVSIVVISVLGLLGNKLKTVFNTITTSLNSSPM